MLFTVTSMLVFLIVGLKYMLVTVRHARPWWVMVSMPTGQKDRWLHDAFCRCSQHNNWLQIHRLQTQISHFPNSPEPGRTLHEVAGVFCPRQQTAARHAASPLWWWTAYQRPWDPQQASLCHANKQAFHKQRLQWQRRLGHLKFTYNFYLIDRVFFGYSASPKS